MNIIPTYSYSYFDEYNQLQTKQFNIFQCFVRKAFGCYAETHLKLVVQKTYAMTLNNDIQAQPEKPQLLKLIAKAETVFGYKKAQFNLPMLHLNVDSKVKISVKYSFNSTDPLKISSIDFYLAFRGEIGCTKDYTFSISKNKSNHLTVYLPVELFHYENIKHSLNSVYLKTINNLLARILNDSSTTSEMADLRYHATTAQELQDPNAALTNEGYSLKMKSYDWKHLKEHPAPEKKVYLLKKENVAKNNALMTMGFSQTLSLAFASSFLEPV